MVELAKAIAIIWDSVASQYETMLAEINEQAASLQLRAANAKSQPMRSVGTVLSQINVLTAQRPHMLNLKDGGNNPIGFRIEIQSTSKAIRY